MNSSKTIIIILIIISIYIIFTIFSDFEKVLSSIKEIDKQKLSIAIGILIITVGLRAGRWHFFLRRVTTQIPLKQSILYYLAGYAFILSPGRAGEIIRSPFIKRDYGVSISKTAPIVLVERFYDMLAITLIISIGLIFSDFDKAVIVLPIGFVVAMFLIIRSKTVFSNILVKISKIKIFSKWIPNVDESFEVIFSLMKTRFFLTGVIVSIVNGVLEATAVYLLILGLGENVSFVNLAVLFHTSSFAANLSLIPGGLGVLEGGLIGLLVLYKIKYEIALSVTILIRLLSTGMFSVIGLISLRIISKK